MKRISLALLVFICATLGHANSWFPAYGGFQVSGNGDDTSFHLDIQNSWANGAFFDGIGMKSINSECPDGSQWGVRLGSHTNNMLHASPYLNFEMSLGLDFYFDGFGFAVGEYFKVVSVYGPIELHLSKLATGCDPLTGFDYCAVLDYTIFIGADGSGSGVGTFDVSRTQIPDTGSTLALFGAGLGLLAIARRRFC